MSAMDFLTSGGMASIGGDLPEDQRNIVNEAVKEFGRQVREYARRLQVPAAILRVRQCATLFAAKDAVNFHVVFIDTGGGNSLLYRDLSANDRILLETIIHQVRIEIGEAVWAFSFSVTTTTDALKAITSEMAHQYVETALQIQHKPDKQPSEEAVAHPDLSSGLEKFRFDHPPPQKTAFVVMQFNNTRPHREIDTVIKDCLKRHGIVGLRADDKQYMDDLFPNVRVYMHACTFGIAVFDRITEEDFNPNVSLEVGYMLGMGKSILLLKDKTLKSLSTDLTGKLYREFDTADADGSLPKQIEKWLRDKGIS